MRYYSILERFDHCWHCHSIGYSTEQKALDRIQEVAREGSMSDRFCIVQDISEWEPTGKNEVIAVREIPEDDR